jgi:hypothetical protein
MCLLQSKPIAIGSATPDDVVHNSDLETLVETSDEWIRTRSGHIKNLVEGICHPLEYPSRCANVHGELGSRRREQLGPVLHAILHPFTMALLISFSPCVFRGVSGRASAAAAS